MTLKDVLGAQVKPGQGVIARINSSGDTKTIWDREDAGSVAVAEREFNDARKEGMMAFQVLEEGNRGVVLDKFDPQAERIVLMPPLAGGSTQ